jgi:hypothetical protein
MTTIYDPWNTDINILDLININVNNLKNIKIMGPKNKNNTRIEIDININYKKTNSQLFISSITSNSIEFELRIIIYLDSKKAEIKRIEKLIKNGTELYSGSDILKLSLKIIKDLEIQEVELDDQSTINCKKRINNENINTRVSMLFTEKISYSLFSLFRFGSTFYMNFGFLAYINDQDVTENIE